MTNWTFLMISLTWLNSYVLSWIYPNVPEHLTGSILCTVLLIWIDTKKCQLLKLRERERAKEAKRSRKR